MIRSAASAAFMVCVVCSATGRVARAVEVEKVLKAARPCVVGFAHGRGSCTGTVVSADAGLIATSASRLVGAGRIVAFSFVEERVDEIRRHMVRIERGTVEIVAVHRSADLALVRCENVRDLAEFRPGDLTRDETAVVVAGMPNAIQPADARDLDVREGSLARVEGGGLHLGVRTYLSSAGAPVLDDELQLLALTAYDVGTRRAHAVSLDRLRELREAPGTHARGAAEQAAYLAGAAVPEYLTISPRPGGPEGKRVAFGDSIFALKEARAIVSTGVFVLDRHDPLEYLACPLANGKLHETVIGIHSDPAVVNLALIALGYKSGGGVERLGDAARPFGDSVAMHVEWDMNEAEAIRAWLATVDPPWQAPNYAGVVERKREGVIRWEPGNVVRMRLEDLAFSQEACAPMEHVSWVYTGSSFGRDEETGRRYYRATVDGVLAAVYRDPVAVFNSPLRSAENDTSYHVNDSIVPPRGTSCILIVGPGAP